MPNRHPSTGQLELMVDRHAIQRTRGLQQRLEEPRFEGPVFHFDQPWEGPLSGYCTVLQDAQTEEFLLYYRGLSDGSFECRRGEVTCVATSTDGVHWQRPQLELHGWQGQTSTNIILAEHAPDSHNFTPFLDTRPETPASERFKALAGVAPIGLHAYHSGDGVNWQRRQKEPVITEGMLDSQNVAFWSAHEQAYVCYLRTWTGEGFSGIRTISRSTSRDFRRWSRPRAMGFGGRPLEHLYTNQTLPYPRAPHLYVGIAARFLPNRQVLSRSEAKALRVDPDYYQDCSDVVLITSRGGYRYHRCMPEAFLRPGIGLEHWVSRTNFPAHGLVQTASDELSFYLNTHYAQPTAQLYRYSLPLDRLAYLEARSSWGEMVSKPLAISTGDTLTLNMATSAAGAVQVALLDESGAPVPYFSWEECGEMIGNELERPVTWRTGGRTLQLGRCGHRKIRLAVRLHDARLYAFHIHPAQVSA